MTSTLLQLLMTAYMGLLHPFFVSMTDINYNSQDKELEISVRIFTDDFENILKKYHKEKIDILHPSDQNQMNGFVSDYIQKHLQLQVNGLPAQMNFVGYEQQSESVWSYFEIKNISKLEKVSVINSLLHDYNNNQINMIHVKAGDKEYSYKLDYPNTNTSFSF